MTAAHDDGPGAMTVLSEASQQGTPPDRRGGVERRIAERRGASARARHDDPRMDLRGGARRCRARRTADVPALVCPTCLAPLQYDANASWALPSSYTVDAGDCRSCGRRFLRNRETGDYDALTW